MKKITSRAFTTTLLFTLIMTVAVGFTGCGGGESETLEDYVKNNEEVQESIDSMSSTSGMTVDISGNTLTYTYAYEQTFDEATIEQMKPQFESAIETMSSTFENIGTSLEEETGIEDIKVKIVYKDGSGAEVYSVEY